MHAKICRINHIIHNTVFSNYIGLLPDEIMSQDELISSGKGIAKLFVSTWVDWHQFPFSSCVLKCALEHLFGPAF